MSEIPRKLPEQIEKLREAWYFFMKMWRICHYGLGIGGTIFATTAAAQPSVLKQLPYAIDSIAWLSAISIGLLTVLRPHNRANAYAASWRILNDACNRYALDDDYQIKDLLEASTKGEQIIQSADPSG